MQMKMNILVNRDNLTIHDSFMVVSENEMKEVLLQVKEEHSECRVFDNRSIGNLVNEWMAYNLLFELGFMSNMWTWSRNRSGFYGFLIFFSEICTGSLTEDK